MAKGKGFPPKADKKAGKGKVKADKEVKGNPFAKGAKGKGAKPPALA